MPRLLLHLISTWSCLFCIRTADVVALLTIQFLLSMRSRFLLFYRIRFLENFLLKFFRHRCTRCWWNLRSCILTITSITRWSDTSTRFPRLTIDEKNCLRNFEWDVQELRSTHQRDIRLAH